MKFTLKGISPFKNTGKDLIDISSIKENLNSGLLNAMMESFDKRQSDTSNSNYRIDDVDRIIDSYAKKNMILAAATSIIPGPLGILGSVPELLLNMKNQMNMIYDLGCATGKENFISKDILLDIPFSAFGGNTNLSQIQNSASLIDSAESILIEKSKKLGQSIVERTLKKSIVQFIPVAGPIVMGTWAKMTTSKISKGSLSFLSEQQIFVEHMKPEENEETKRLLQIEKIKALANLIESNNDINEDQIEFIGAIIENSALSDSEKEYYLEESIKEGSKFSIDVTLLKLYEEEDDLLMQLVVMARRSGSVDAREKEYIYLLGGELSTDTQLIDNLFL